MSQSEKSQLFKTALIGGIVGGILSGIPFLNFLNCCFCLLNVAGAVLATHLYLRNSETKISTGEAAMLGAISGFISGLVASILNAIFSFITQFIFGGPNPFAELLWELGLHELTYYTSGMGFISIIISVLINLILYIPAFAITGALGAMGFANFMKKDLI